MIIKTTIIVIFLILGFQYFFEASGLQSSLSSDLPTMFFQTLYNGNSMMGIVWAYLSPNPSFVVGENITARIQIGLPNASNETYLIEVMFLDAFVIRDIPPYTWQQDWSYLVNNIVINGTEQDQTLSNVTLFYAQEGTYGLNMTITRASTDTKMNFHFDNLVQIKPLSYLQDQFKSNATFALNYEILGLTLIMVGPVMVQLANFVEKIFEKPKDRNLKTAQQQKTN